MDLNGLKSSVTRFGEFLPLLQKSEIFGNIFKVYFIIGKVLNNLGTIFVRLDNFSLV